MVSGNELSDDVNKFLSSAFCCIVVDVEIQFALVYQGRRTMSEEKKRLSPLVYESMDGKDYPPYVPAGKRIKEFSVRAIILGVFLAVILGAANAYLGLKVGMTVSASIPAAGVIFTIPALYLLGLAPEMITVTLMAGLGGVLGLLMMIPLRRAVVVQEHGKLPFPEGTACAEVLVAGEVGGG